MAESVRENIPDYETWCMQLKAVQQNNMFTLFELHIYKEKAVIVCSVGNEYSC